MSQDPQLSVISRNTLLQHLQTYCAIAARVENIDELVDELFPNGENNPSIVGQLTVDQAIPMLWDFAYAVCPQDVQRVADAPTPEPTTPTIEDDVKVAIQYNPELASLSESTILEHAYGICSIAASQPGTDYWGQRADFYSASGLTLEQGASIGVWVSQFLCPEDYQRALAEAGVTADTGFNDGNATSGDHLRRVVAAIEVPSGPRVRRARRRCRRSPCDSGHVRLLAPAKAEPGQFGNCRLEHTVR